MKIRNNFIMPCILTACLFLTSSVAIAQSLTKKLLDGTTWEGKYNIESRRSYTAPTTITLEIAPSGDLRGKVVTTYFDRTREIPAQARIRNDGVLLIDFSSGSVERTLRLSLKDNELTGDAESIVRGFIGRGEAKFTKK